MYNNIKRLTLKDRIKELLDEIGNYKNDCLGCLEWAKDNRIEFNRLTTEIVLLDKIIFELDELNGYYNKYY